jgi:hypothetical protein
VGGSHNCLTFKYPFNHDYAYEVEKMIIIAFTFDLFILAFFILGEVDVSQCIDCLFVSVRVTFSISLHISDMLLDFHPNHESVKTALQGHTKQSSEANQLIQKSPFFFIQETSGLSTFHSIPTPTSLTARMEDTRYLIAISHI